MTNYCKVSKVFLQLLSIGNDLQLLFHLLVPPDAHTDNTDTDNKLEVNRINKNYKK